MIFFKIFETLHNATEKMEISCTKGKFHVNIFHDLEAIKKPLFSPPSVKKMGSQLYCHTRQGGCGVLKEF